MTKYQAKGKYFEDFVLGEEFCSQSRTVTEADIVNFAGLSGDYMQIHTSEQFAEDTVLKGRIAHGFLTMAISTGQSFQMGILDGTVIALLESHITFAAPVRIGDSVHTVTRVTQLQETKKPDRGIMVSESNVLNQREEVVLRHVDKVMLLRRP